MAGFLSTEIRCGGKWRLVVRVFVAIALALVMLSLLECSSGRGFLASKHNIVWLEARPLEDDAWDVRVVEVGTHHDDDPVHSGDEHLRCFRVQQNSFGRTDPGSWSAWRHDHWMIEHMYTSSERYILMSERPESADPGLSNALHKFMLDELVEPWLEQGPWPDVPAAPTNWGDHGLSMHRDRVYSGRVVATIAMSLLVASVLSVLVIPLRRKDDG